MSKLTASYIAGFVDGEGYISIYPVKRAKSIYYISCVKISNTNKEIIDWFYNSFGGYYHTRKFNGKSKTAYTFSLTDKKVVPFLKKIIPYLRIKNKQANLVLKREKLKEKIINLGHRNGMLYKANIQKEIEKIYKELKKLNKRGKDLHAERLSKETPNKEKR